MTSITIKQIAKFKTQEEAEWTKTLVQAIRAKCRRINHIVIQRKSVAWGSTGIRSAIAQSRGTKRTAWINLAKLSYLDDEGNFMPDYDMIATLVNYFNSAEVQSFFYQRDERMVMARLTTVFGSADIARELMNNTNQ